MPNSMIFEGKTTNEAIENGLKHFKVSKDMVEIKVLEEEKRSFFSILTPRVVKVEMCVKEGAKIEKKSHHSHKHNTHKEKIAVNESDKKEAENIVKAFLEEFISKLPSKEIEYDIKFVEEYMEVSIQGKNISYLIGYRGETLGELQVLLNSILRNKVRTGVKVIVDICGYKKERQKTLEELAEKVARSVIKTGKTVTLEPMRPYERKIIHSKLQENNKIRTHSVGEEPHRKIVISLNKAN